MKRIVFVMIAILSLCGNLKAEDQKQVQDKEETMKMEIMPKGTQKSFKGPEDMFTGDVQVDMLFPSNETAHYSGAYVTFQPGARTAWHLHPAGQHMIVTSGVGLTGTRDRKIVTMNTGDTIWCPPDIDHWHGATPHSPMTHLVVTGELDGKNVVWKEKVTDDQYLGK
jgi:4-carboxymuconolactone decarboxylase